MNKKNYLNFRKVVHSLYSGDVEYVSRCNLLKYLRPRTIKNLLFHRTREIVTLLIKETYDPYHTICIYLIKLSKFFNFEAYYFYDKFNKKFSF